MHRAVCHALHAWCKACDRGHWAAPQRALRCAEFRARTHTKLRTLCQVTARAIFELKYLVGFAIATIAVANQTRGAADEAHCRQNAAAAAAAAPVRLAVGRLLGKVSSDTYAICLDEKKARLTYGWDLNDLEADVPLLGLIGIVFVTQLAAFLWVLHQAIEEKPVASCHSNAGPAH